MTPREQIAQAKIKYPDIIPVAIILSADCLGRITRMTAINKARRSGINYIPEPFEEYSIKTIHYDGYDLSVLLDDDHNTATVLFKILTL